MNDEQLYQECAISALRGIMEMGSKLGVYYQRVAEHAFDFADHIRPGLKF